MKTYECRINDSDNIRRVKADSPRRAAKLAWFAWMTTRDFFANEAPEAATVTVDGVEHIPEHYAPVGYTGPTY